MIKIKTKNLGIIIIVIIILFSIFFIFLNNQKPPLELTEIQEFSCEAADEGNTCFTKLQGLEIVNPEECCQALNLCCQND